MSILAIDFGGTRTRAAWFTDGLALHRREEMRSRVDQPIDIVIQRIVELARSVAPPTSTWEAIGISAPGPLDAQRGIIHRAKTLPGWHDVPLGARISQAFGGTPTYIQNDGSLAALAEYHLGAAQNADPTVYLTLSTGIGGGAVIGGALFTGGDGLAIEPGHQQFTLPDGSIRRLEELASGTALGQLAQKRLAESEAPSLLRAQSTVDGKAVGEAAQQGDALAREVVEEAGRWLGLGLVNILHLFNPQAIVIGGGAAQLGELLLAPARAVIRARLLDPAFAPPGLVRPAALGDDVCLFGAALHAKASARPAPPPPA